MYTWSLRDVELELKQKWAIHGGDVLRKINNIVTVSCGPFSGQGEIACSTKNGDAKIITKDLANISWPKIQSIRDVQKLNVCPQVKHSLELAIINLHLQEQNMALHTYLNIPQTKSIESNFSIPLMPIKNIGPYIESNSINNYKSCKVKINNKHSFDLLSEVSKHYKGPLRIDANESFESVSDFSLFVDTCNSLNIEFIEQPLSRRNKAGNVPAKELSPWPIIGDESIQDEDISLSHISGFDGLNIKLMKSGGPTQALKQIKSCKENGLKVLIGCMIESSLNISTALKLGYCADWFDLDGWLLLKDDPFKLLTNNYGTMSLY